MQGFPETPMSAAQELLPLFPLPRTVLFPGMRLPLYIHEPRYKEMVKLCLERESPLVVLLLGPRRGKARRSESACRVGGAGHIVEHRVVGARGEMEIVVLGERRVRVVDLVPGTPYLQGRVESLEDEPSPGRETGNGVADLRQAFLQTREFRPEGGQGVDEALGRCQGPGPTADFVASALPLTAGARQALLEILDPRERVGQLSEVIRRERLSISVLYALAGDDPTRFQGG